MYAQQLHPQAQYQPGAQSAPRERNPDSIPSRLEQAKANLDDLIDRTRGFRSRLVSSEPHPCNNLNQSQSLVSMPPPVSDQIDGVQARITELQEIVADILKHF